MSNTKSCAKCGRNLPTSEFYKHSETLDGLRGSCKQCFRGQNKEWVQRNPAKMKEIRRATYLNNIGYHRARYHSNLELSRAICRENARLFRALMTPEERKDKSRRAYWSNIEKSRARSRSNQRRRRAAIRGSIEHFTEAQFQELCASYGNKCLCCGKSGERLQPDHVKPLSKHGSDGIQNIQPLCRFCNQSKNAKEIDFRPVYAQCREAARRGV
jgi:5-methylcytosine-specific restriction endonuclease McrA